MKNKIIFLFLFWGLIASAQNKKDSSKLNYFQLRRNIEKKFKTEDSLESIKNKDSNEKEEENDKWGCFNNWTWFWDSRSDKNGSPDSYADEMYKYINDCNNKLKGKKAVKNANNGSTQNWTAIGPFNNSSGLGSNHQDIGRTNCVWASSSTNTVYIGASSGGLWKSTTGGGNWICITEQLPSFGVNDIAVDPTNSDRIFIATGKNMPSGSIFDEMNWGYGVFFTTNGGQTWNTNSMQNLTATERRITKVLINPADPQTIYALSKTTVYKSYNGGITWINKNAPTLRAKPDNSGYFSYDNIKMNPNDTNEIFISSSGGGYLYRSSNGGTTWSSNLIFNTLSALGFYRHNFGHGFTIDYNPNTSYLIAGIYIRPITDSSYYNNVWHFNCYSNCDQTHIYSSTNSGNSFNLLSNNNNLSYDNGMGFNLIMTITQNNIYFGIYKVATYNFQNDNYSLLTMWHADIRGFAAYTTSGVDDVVYVANDGGIMKGDQGGNWTDINNGMNIGEYYSIGISEANSDVIAGGKHDNGTNMSNNNGNTWSNIDWGDGGTTYINPTNDSNIYYTWNNNFTAGYLLPQYNSPLVENPVSKRIYLSTISGANKQPLIIFSDDYGAFGTWSNAIPLEPKQQTINNINYIVQGATAIGYSISNSNTLYYALDLYQFDYFPWLKLFLIKKTTNGGTSVSNITANFDQSVVSAGKITGIVTHPSNPDLVWVCIESIMGDGTVKKVFQSTDGGTTWQDYSTGLSDIPCLNMIFDEADQKLLLGTDVGVYYRHLTDDSWHLMNNSQFPQVMATDMKINRKTGDLYISTYGRGIWKTNLPGYCYDAANPILINTTTTWNTTHTICSDIVVTSGTFTITADQVLPTQASITVQNGAILFVDNCTITNSNIIVNSGGKIVLQNNGILELNDDDTYTINGMKDMTYGEIKKMHP